MSEESVEAGAGEAKGGVSRGGGTSKWGLPGPADVMT
jgi:hypothetical protein